MNVSIHRRWLWSAVASALLAGGAAAQLPAPILTKNAALRLPVQLDERDRANVAEIKLFVQGPGGRWECVETGNGAKASFDYKVPADGDYRFTFVTVDRRGQAMPADVAAVPPHRLVTVDTTPPDFSATPVALKDGTALQCQIIDPAPDWTSLKVMFQSSDGSWQPLHSVGKESPTLFRVPSPSVLRGRIRIAAADRAGNKATREFDLGDPSAPAKPMIAKGRPDPAMFTRDVEPAAAKATEFPALPDVTKTPKIEATAIPPLPDMTKTPRIEPTAIPPLPDVPVPPRGGEPPLDLRLPDMKVTSSPPPATPKKEEKDYLIPEGVSPRKEESLKLPEVSVAPPAGVVDLKLPLDVPPPPAIPAATPPSKGTALKPVEPPPIATKPVEPPPTVATKPVGTPQILNTRTCEFAYEMDGGARFANKMTFWATADNGRTWMPLKDASAGVSPARLTLPADGLFGIRLRPGGGGKPPEPGEEPDCLVEIDSTKPVVTLLQPTLGNDEGIMTLNWTASDTNLLGNSINLSYALKAEGPWEVIVSGYKNEGVYRWTLPTTLSGSVFLRADAMDRAGNIGRVELPSPVMLEASKQRVKVLGVAPGK